MSLEAGTLLLQQAELQGRIARASDNLRRAGSAGMTMGGIDSRVQMMDSNWKKFEANHDALRASYWAAVSEQDYVRQDIFGNVEENYLQQRGAFLDLLSNLRSRSMQGSPPAAPAGEGLARRALPRIQLPHFSGAYDEWPSFRDLFRSLVESDKTLTCVERLHYLKTSLRGEAELLVRNIAVTAENYERAWSTLVDHYENKRLLVRSCFASFTTLPQMKSESAQELKRVYHGMLSTYGTLESIGRPLSNCSDLFVHLVLEMLDNQSRREWETSVSDSADPPSYETLRTFLECRLRTLEVLQLSKGNLKSATKSSDVKPSASSRSAARAYVAQGSRKAACVVCQKDHYILTCDDFKKRNAQARRDVAVANNLCFNCFGRHLVTNCKSKFNCSTCKERHHSSIHEVCATSVSAPVAPATTNAVTTLLVQRPPNRVAVLLATARVDVTDENDVRHRTRALVDPGSEVSIVSEALVRRLRLRRTAATVDIFGVGGQRSGASRGRVTIQVAATTKEFSFQLSALILPRITADCARFGGSAPDWPHVRDLNLADSEFTATDRIELLLGADAYAVIVEDGLRKGCPGTPVAQRTSLGWILSGVIGEDTAVSQACSLQCRIDDELSDSVKRFWEQEEPPKTPTPLTEAERQCEEHFARTHSRDKTGRFTVRLPKAASMPALYGTRYTAVRVLHHMEHRFLGDTDLRQKYKAFMVEYETLGHMEAVTSVSEARLGVCYLPHHGVMKANDDTAKLRVVFNGSSRLASGESLNQYLMTGPNLLPSLLDVILRWRMHEFVFVADIEKMYRQILVHPEDRDLQRIVWRDTEDESLQEYQLTTVTYGLACAPYLAIRTLHQLADDERQQLPRGAEVLKRDVYVDDILTGAATLQDALAIQKQLAFLCKAGGFPLRKWSANKSELLAPIPVEHRQSKADLAWEADEGHFTLGLRWHPHTDSFSFRVRSSALERVTKRTVLSQTARLFDPLGWLAPVTISAKILIQSAWLQRLDWDELMAANDERAWRQFLEELPTLENIRIPRWTRGGRHGGQLEIHGFADASERAYAAAVYLRINEADNITVTLVAAKAKVAPIRPISLPRLELCGAALLSRLVKHIRDVLSLTHSRTVLWSDSTVALAWIHGHPSRWKTYVANRVTQIQTELPDAHWRHTPGKDNPADCASRGVTPKGLLSHSLWWHGPPWLTNYTLDRPPATLNDKDIPEQRTRVHAAGTGPKEDEMLLRFSSLNRLLRVTAWCRRWLRTLHSRQSRLDSSPHLSSGELDAALTGWILTAQAKWFERERRLLASKASLPGSSPLSSLSPFLNEQGIIRVGGRLKHSLLGQDEQHSIILPRRSHLSMLIVDACHRRTLHGGVQLTLGTLRQRFWLPGGRQTVRRLIHRCLPCLRWRAAATQPMMGALPHPRVRPSRPFTNTGVDYAGPILLRTSKGRGQKAYKAFVAIFVCLATKALHIEVVSDYSTDAFLAAFRRFVSRRGLCRTIYSDRGTNFVGADAQLRALFRTARSGDQSIGGILASEGVEWRFNPPSAPHFGGLWEAAVKSVKHHLRRVIGNKTLTHEEMATFLCQVEAILNSRPLMALSDDPEDLTALTPGHFLVGDVLTAVPEPTLGDEPPNRLSRWQDLQQMRDHFWTRWSREYLQSLAARSKWRRPGPSIQIGDLCLIKTEMTPPSRWALARVIKTHPGDDGQVRVVTLRTATTTLKRPVVKLIVIPSADHE